MKIKCNNCNAEKNVEEFIEIDVWNNEKICSECYNGYAGYQIMWSRYARDKPEMFSKIGESLKEVKEDFFKYCEEYDKRGFEFLKKKLDNLGKKLDEEVSNFRTITNPFYDYLFIAEDKYEMNRVIKLQDMIIKLIEILCDFSKNNDDKNLFNKLDEIRKEFEYTAEKDVFMFPWAKERKARLNK